MLQQVLVVGSTKTSCFDLFNRMKLPYTTKCTEAYPRMRNTMTHNFDAIVVNLKDLPITYIREVERYFADVLILEYFGLGIKDFEPPIGKVIHHQADDCGRKIVQRVDEECKRVYQILTEVNMDSAFGSYVNKTEVREILANMGIV
jgi:hypothetical protein